MAMDAKKAFELITNKLEKALSSQDIKKESVSSTSEEEFIALFAGTSVAYSVSYDVEDKLMEFTTCGMTEDGPDNEWATLSKWMFDPDTDSDKQAESIANDFVDTVVAPTRTKAIKTAKKKKSDEGNANPLFLAKRFVNVFPELKAEIAEEVNYYDPFRGVTFTKNSIVPKVNQALGSGDKQVISKLGGILTTQYNNGDIDTRSIITIVILNSIDTEAKEEKIMEYLSDDLKKAWTSAKKFKNKQVKPEKRKTKKPTMVERLTGQ